MSAPIGPVGGGPGPDALEALRSGRIREQGERLEAATRLLEGSFYMELFKAMRTTVPEGGALPGGSGQEMFETLLDQSMADAAAARSERGVGRALYEHFVRRMPELAHPAPAPGADPTR